MWLKKGWRKSNRTSLLMNLSVSSQFKLQVCFAVSIASLMTQQWYTPMSAITAPSDSVTPCSNLPLLLLLHDMYLTMHVPSTSITMENGDCKVCQNVGATSTLNMAKNLKAEITDCMQITKM